jgi:hypothetical protein
MSKEQIKQIEDKINQFEGNLEILHNIEKLNKEEYINPSELSEITKSNTVNLYF